MITRTLSAFVACLLLSAGAAAHDHAAMQAAQGAKPAAASANIPGDSLHRLAPKLTDQRGKRFSLADEQAPATLITMFYGDCQISCPIALENAKRSLEAIPETQRSKLHAVLISLNPGVDTPASLKRLAELHALPAQGLRLAVADNDTATRQLAAALGVKYRRAANGEINHSTRFVVLDSNGRITATSERLAVEPDPELLAAIRQQIGN